MPHPGSHLQQIVHERCKSRYVANATSGPAVSAQIESIDAALRIAQLHRKCAVVPHVLGDIVNEQQRWT